VADFCRCKTPDLAASAEGILYCRECGERVRDARERIRDATLLEQSKRIKALEEIAASKGNGHAPGFPPELAEEIAERIGFAPRPVTVSYERAASMLGIGRTLFIEEVLPHVKVLRIRGKRVVRVAELERYAEEFEEPWVSDQ
jgi:hypothetical protein